MNEFSHKKTTVGFDTVSVIKLYRNIVGKDLLLLKITITGKHKY